VISPEALRRYSFLAGVKDESLKAIAMISEERSFPAGSTLFRENAAADHLYIIMEGEVDIRYAVGDEYRTVDTLVAGELMVWSALVPPHEIHSVSVARNNTRVIAIDGPKLGDLCEQDPKLGFRLMREIAETVSHRLEGARIQLASIN
jgi:CRP/FNR family transcriptional regulator, cyclic AMP receptor protein